MNKFKKIATAVVSTVMAGTMLASLAACTPKDPGTDGPDGNNPGGEKLTALLNHIGTTAGGNLREKTNAKGWTTAKEYWKYLSANKDETTKDLYNVRNADGSINYSSYTRSSEVTLNLAIGHNNLQTSTHFSTSLGTTIKLPDNNSYGNGSAKPAWKAMGQDLNIKWNDVYAGNQTNSNLKYLVETIDNNGKQLYLSTDMFTTDLAYAVEYSSKGTNILNLADYLDYMPHYKEYLESNSIVYLSLLQAGMGTAGDNAGEGKTIFVAPYFDGNDAIERYCIIRQDWANKVLNGGTDLTGSAKYSEACGDVAVESYMGKTGKYEIESANDDGSAKITITKDYDKALAAAKDENKNLGKAYKTIAGAAYAGDSGNIVDIMNAALAANKDATGDQLAKLYRAYIDVCYLEDGAQYYTADNRADVFNGVDACWDVDDLVAILRIIRSSGTSLVVSGREVKGIVPRTGQNDRTPDMVRLAAQLYGVRGADSRYEYTYIDQAGELQDARNDREFYVALENMNKLVQEGLVETYPASDGFSYNGGSLSTKDKGEAFMMYDYAQTQTKNNYYANEGVSSSTQFAEGFNFAPVVTPVSKWDVDGDGNHTDIMRFTESWRSTKTSGLALNGALKDNPEKLKAALQFVDYLYSADGQIVSTYGPMAANADGNGGFWYNEEATADEISAGKYFTFKGKKYSGTEFGKKFTPTVTENLYKSFLGQEVYGLDISKVEDIAGGKLSFTDYARRIIGSTLPVGVKDQSFENQLTSKAASAGANKVAKNLALGTVKGLEIDIDEKAEGFNWWYVCVPTGMPISSTESRDILNASSQDNLKYMTGTQKANKNFFSIFNYIILNGFNGTYNYQDVSYTF